MMKRLVLASLIVLAAVPAYRSHAQEGAAVMPLRSARETVTTMYEVLSDVSAGEARAIYQSLSVDVRSDLWTYQLEQFLARNPRLTPEQHALAMEAIGLLSSGIFQQQARGGDHAMKVDALVDSLASRAAVVFTPEQRAIFSDLGRHTLPAAEAIADKNPPARPRGRIQATAARPRWIAANGDCECNTDPHHDFCGNGPTAPIEKCKAVPMSCTRTTCCCGWFWTEACNGLCGLA
jgi:hypothetical protein